MGSLHTGQDAGAGRFQTMRSNLGVPLRLRLRVGPSRFALSLAKRRHYPLLLRGFSPSVPPCGRLTPSRLSALRAQACQWPARVRACMRRFALFRLKHNNGTPNTA